VNSSGRDTALMKQAQSKRLSGSLNIFKTVVIERSKSQRLLYVQKDTGNDDLIILNAARSPSEMQISPCYWDVIITTDTTFY